MSLVWEFGCSVVQRQVKLEPELTAGEAVSCAQLPPGWH